MGWVARYTSPDTGANVQLVTRDATSPEDSVISVHTPTSKVPMKRRGRSATRCEADSDRAMGRTPVPRPGPRRQRHQHRESPGLKRQRAPGPLVATSGERDESTHDACSTDSDADPAA